jgi:hypothetical protein
MIGPISSFGGPYIVLPTAQTPGWRGAADQAAYDAVCRGPDEGRVIALGTSEGLVLGTPDNLYFSPTPTGGVFVRVEAFDAADDELLGRLVAKVPDDDWEPLGSLRVPAGGLRAFDSAIAGDDAPGDSLEIELPAGTYSFSYRPYRPDDGTELILNRLVRE